MSAEPSPLAPAENGLAHKLGPFDATLTTLSVGAANDGIEFESQTGLIAWLNLTTPTILYTASLEAFPIVTLWANYLPTIDSPIATTAIVPEPSSAVLASIGAVVAFLAYGWSRQRRVHHRLEAN